MKLIDRMPRRFKRQSYPDDLVMILFVIATAGMVSLIPLMTVEIASSSVNNPALWGEAGLWSELGAKD
jgi:hypothetical protein